MQVELFLRNITQETFRGDVGADWNGNVWSVSCCVLNLGKLSRDDVVLPAEQQGFILRSEPEGGIFWDPDSNAVYRVDQEAYHAMLELDRGTSENEIARRLGVPRTSVDDLVRSLTQIRTEARGEAE